MHKNIKAKQTRPSSADRLIPVPRHSNATSLSVEKKKNVYHQGAAHRQ